MGDQELDGHGPSAGMEDLRARAEAAANGRDGSVDGRDGSVDGRDGSIDRRDGSANGKDGSIGRRDGSASGRDGSVDGRDGSHGLRRHAVDGLRPHAVDALRPRGGPMLAEVTKAMVRLHSEYYGRGATKARTEWVGEDMLVCVLRDCFTRVERTLIEYGEQRTVRETRQVFQDAMADRFTSAVQEIVGRPVVGFLSQISPAPEIVVEIFVFDPQEHADGYHGRGAGADGLGTQAREAAEKTCRGHAWPDRSWVTPSSSGHNDEGGCMSSPSERLDAVPAVGGKSSEYELAEQDAVVAGGDVFAEHRRPDLRAPRGNPPVEDENVRRGVDQLERVIAK